MHVAFLFHVCNMYIYRSKNEEEEDPESQEVLEMQVVRQLTKENIELLGELF